VRGDSEAGDTSREGVAGGVADGAGSEGFTGSDHGEYVAGVGTLRAAGGDLGGGSETIVVRKVSSSEWVEDTTGSTLAARDYKDTGDVVVQPAVLLTMREGAPGGGKGPLLTEEESLTLATGNGQTLFQPQPEQYGVRRLTPVECERLQAFPDGWTEPAVSDSARYKALGNAVTVNTVRWVLGRMLKQS
jgi:site-specific DNA-cytosine methylase